LHAVDLYETHQFSILSALGRNQECFKMKRLLTQGDKSPHKAVEKFLLPLGFEKIISGNDNDDAITTKSFCYILTLTFWIDMVY
jgi:hypothetical protein